MPKPLVVMGPAGTGKTTHLLELAGEHASRLLTLGHQRLLAVSFMNGARARLDLALQKAHPAVPKTVYTLDKLAAVIVNRWRQAESLTFPVAASASANGAGPVVQHYRTRLGFDEVVSRAATLLSQPAVVSWIRNSFPIIIVDEFQDCTCDRLSFVQALSSVTQVIVAADAFQLLDSDYPDRCPAVDWVQTMEAQEGATVEHLSLVHRTHKQALLAAAHALRDGQAARTRTIPVVHAPAAALLATECLYFMKANRSNSGSPHTWALLTPSLADPILPKVLDSLDKQLTASGRRSIPWRTQNSGEVDYLAILDSLGIKSDDDDDMTWTPITDETDPLHRQIMAAVRRFARLRGMTGITCGLVRQFAETALHARSAYTTHRPRFLATTIHGAKNREFDNVIIFWGFKRPKDNTLQRKLLYNAITRAKNAALLLVFDPVRALSADPVLSLLGQAKILGGRAKRKNASLQ